MEPRPDRDLILDGAEAVETSSARSIPWGHLISRPAGDAEEETPWRVSVRDLSRNLSKVLAMVHEQSCPTVITYRGLPTWVVLPLDQTRLASFLLSNVEELTDHVIRSADDQTEKLLEKGELRTLSQYLA